MKIAHSLALLVISLPLFSATKANTNVVTDWNVKTNDFVVAGKLSLLTSSRTIAIGNAVVFDVVNTITRR